MKSRVKEIAESVREKCRLYALKDGNYCPDLTGLCAIASYILKSSLRKEKIKSRVICGVFDESSNFEFWENEEEDNHCWLEVDNEIVDITASQFGLEDIHITVAKDSRYKKNLEIKRIKLLKDRGWPDYQLPRKDIVKKILTTD